VNRKLCVSLLSIAAFVSAGVMEGRAETLMTRHVREATINGQAKLLGRLPATQIMQLDIVLPVRDRDGLLAAPATAWKCRSEGRSQRSSRPSM
jgi:hypothetical protein